MCSILGVIYRNPQHSIDLNEFKRINRTLQHRGPDDSGVIKFGNLIMGNNRLSIIGIESKHAKQPIKKNGNALIFNGEIYNYKHISYQLENDGVKCSNTSDTEVLFKALMYWGIDKTLKKIDGMFAFAFYSKNDGIFLARDQMGEKPLYWSYQNNRFWFSSEIKSILKGQNNKAEPNMEKINEFFYSGKIYGKNTFFKDIFEVQPGEYINFKKDLSKINKKIYWNVENFHSNQSFISYNNIKDNFKKKLNSSINSCSVSDVSVGVFLSGGLDSNTILNSLLYSDQKNIELFFADNQQKNSSEYDNVSLSLNFFRKKFPDKNIILNKNLLSNKNYLYNLKQFTWYNDEPTLSQLSPQLMNLSLEASKKKIKVLLSGEGADELLFGYTRFLRTKKIISKSKDKNFILKHLYFGGGINNLNIISEITNFDNYEDNETWQWLNHYYDKWSKDTLQMIYSQKFRLQSLLQRQDRIGMANGVEVRSPFIRPDFVNWCNCLPHEYKFSSGKNKKILRDIMKGNLHEKILNGMKMGSPSFIENWLENKDSYPFILRIVSNKDGFIQSYLNGNKAIQIIHDHYQGSQSFSYIIWLFLVLETWHNVFINPSYEYMQ